MSSNSSSFPPCADKCYNTWVQQANCTSTNFGCLCGSAATNAALISTYVICTTEACSSDLANQAFNADIELCNSLGYPLPESVAGNITSSIPPTNSSSSPTTSSTTPSSSNSKSGLSGGAIAGIAVGAVAIVTIVIAALLFLCRKRGLERYRHRKEKNTSAGEGVEDGVSGTDEQGVHKAPVEANAEMMDLQSPVSELGAMTVTRAPTELEGEHLLEKEPRFELA